LERWLPWVPFNNTREASLRYAEACTLDWDAGRAVRFGIRDRATRELLGVVGLDSCIHLHRSCELGYWLRREATGRGLMTEAARSTVDFAFSRMGVHRVRCAAATDNVPSLRVILRLDFRFEGIARQAELVQSRWLDHAVFAKLSQDE
jgi:ribosomal-protein-serine acetyltransferase